MNLYNFILNESPPLKKAFSQCNMEIVWKKICFVPVCRSVHCSKAYPSDNWRTLGTTAFTNIYSYNADIICYHQFSILFHLKLLILE